MTAIYLDNNATTFLHSAVAAAMHDCYCAGFANPASQHSAGRKARRIVEDARDEIASLLGAETRGMNADRLIFTSGGTESNNLAIRGLSGEPPGRVVVSAIEHPSVAGAAEYLTNSGFDVRRLDVNGQGVVQLPQLSELLTEGTRMVSVMLANNETGVIQPIRDVSRICRERGIAVHTDAVQAVGKMSIDFRSLDVDGLSFSAHKFHGPQGIGGLIVRHGVAVRPILYGGFQQAGFRPGTEPVALVVGLCCAVRLAIRGLTETADRVTRLRDRLANRLRDEWPTLRINGEDAARLPHTLNVAFPGINRQALVMALDMAGVACSSGSACASGSSEPSPVLVAMGLPGEIVESSIRFSLSSLTSDSDIADASGRIVKVLHDLQPQRRSLAGLQPPRQPSLETL